VIKTVTSPAQLAKCILFTLIHVQLLAPSQWCSKTAKLQDQHQDHLIFQDQDRSGQYQDQDRLFKTKT